MNDKISIILPIFNVGNHLKGGIDSLINQTIGSENLEIIMVNDCSTDGSGEIIDEYAEQYDCCVSIHHEKNSGAAYTPLNTGIDPAQEITSCSWTLMTATHLMPAKDYMKR